MPTSLRAIAEKASTTGPVRKRTVLKSPVRENCTPGSVRGRSGNWPTYLDGIVRTTYENFIHCTIVSRDHVGRLHFFGPSHFQKLYGQFGRLCHRSRGR